MSISLINGQAPVEEEYIPLEENWISAEFNNLKDATDWAMPRGWAAKPQRLQVRNFNNIYLVERYDPNGCGCGG